MASLITGELLEKAFRRHKDRRPIRVKSFTVSPGCKAGESFASIVLSVKAVFLVDNTEVVKDLIIKLQRKEGFVGDLAGDKADIFVKESLFYSEVVPAMVHLQKRAGLETNGLSVPRFYYSETEEGGRVIVLENLASTGYVSWDKHKGLGNDECMLVMKEIATFHALAYALKKQDPHGVNKYEHVTQEAIFHASFPSYWKIVLKTTLPLVKNVTTDQKLVEAAEKFSVADMDQLIKEIVRAVEPFAMICHGDLWTNNLLFRYESIDGKVKPVQVKLLDFQCLRYASPATDLSYFFYASTTRSTRKQQLHNLLSFYHNTFVEYLNFLGMDFPEFTFAILKEQFRQVSLLGISVAFPIASGMFCSPGDGDRIAQLRGKEIGEYQAKLLIRLFNNEEHRHFIQERIIGGIEDAIEMGLL